MTLRRLCLLVCLAAVARAQDAGPAPLPPPPQALPELPPQRPSVVTAGGQRLLLEQTFVSLRFDPATGTVSGNRPGWWIINYPLERLGDPDTVSRALYGVPAAQVRNGYLMLPGDPGPEPAAPTGPAPIVPAPEPDIVVSVAAPNASDEGPGTAQQPLRTIAAAVARAQPGTTIQVMPGIYRESVSVEVAGTAAAPVRLEGVRDADGKMPVISGNDPFPADAWRPVAGLPGVWRADLFTGRLGTMSLAGEPLRERSVPQDLEPGQYALNRASAAFLDLRGERAEPRPGDDVDGRTWRRVAVDGDGHLALPAGNSVTWASTWVWVPPKPRKEGVVWDPRFPEPVTGTVQTAGRFRAARESGSSLAAQVNKYRVWVNGERLPSVVYSQAGDEQVRGPVPHRNYGKEDRWENFPLREGWNHLLLQFDTTTEPDQLRFRLNLPKGAEAAVTSADPPADRQQPPAGATADHVTEWLVLDPIPADGPDRGVYVRLPDDADPNQADLDLAARGSELVTLAAPHVELRGFEIRGGAQFQQRDQVTVTAPGCLVEGCLIRDSEVGGIGVGGEPARYSQAAAPIVLRGNWIVNPGNVGISGSFSSELLTADNLAQAPGRGRLIVEHNTIVNNNWTGTRPFWESGAMKLFRLTGAVLRHNTIVGGTGPGIWLDWEHYNNRLEGNRFLNGWAFGTGVEASPGPNLVANNLVVDLRPGYVWFRYGVLSWSSDRNLVLHNTIDGRWNPLPTWFDRTGGDGIFLSEGGDDRGTRWGALTSRRQVILNNLVIGCDWAVRPKEADRVGGNYTDKGTGAEPLEPLPAFLADNDLDYRPPRPGALPPGVATDETALVRHDANGLLRFPDDPPTPGAFRPERTPVDPTALRVEAELTDGTMRRGYAVEGGR